MMDQDFKHILSQASNPPDCPNDKFVNAFLAQMDIDLAPATNSAPKNKMFIYGSMAAAFLVVIGGGLTIGRINSSFDVAHVFTKKQNVAPYNDAEIIAVIDKEIAEDDFVAQLTGDDDISTIVPINKTSNP